MEVTNTVVVNGDHTVRAASRIDTALEALSTHQIRVVERQMCVFPATASDPKRPGPIKTIDKLTSRPVYAKLVGAGTDALVTAAAALAEWADPVVSSTRLAELLDRWLPDGAVSPTAGLVTKRLLCDQSRLVSTRWSTDVVSLDALGWFAVTAKDIADDVGLIDTAALGQAAAQRGWDAPTIEAFTRACGFTEILGRLALRVSNPAACKAALLQAGRPASPAEVAATAGVSTTVAAQALTTAWSTERVGPGLYNVCEYRRHHDFTQTLRDCADDAGLIDESALAREAARWGRDPTTWLRAGRCVRLLGRRALANTPKARTKAALFNLDRPATAGEIAKAAGLPKYVVEPTLPKIRSLTRLTRGRDAKWITDETGDGDFATVVQAVRRCTDDVGLINIDALRDDPATQALRAPLAEICAACGWTRMSGRFATADTQSARIKAALLHLDRAATIAEIAATAGLTPETVAQLSPSIASLTRIGPRRFANEACDGQLKYFVAAVQTYRDDVGLIDETALRTQVDRDQLGRFETLVGAAGLVRLHGRLAISDTIPAAVKAALLDLGRPATLRELSTITRRPLKSVRVATISHCDSVQRVDGGPRHTTALYDIVDTF